MKLITKRDVIKSVPDRWARQYSIDKGYLFDGRSTAKIFAELLKLDTETCTEKDVAAVIGNTSWVRLECDCCEKNVDAVVSIKDNISDTTISICKDCAADTLDAFKISKHEDNDE